MNAIPGFDGEIDFQRVGLSVGIGKQLNTRVSVVLLSLSIAMQASVFSKATSKYEVHEPPLCRDSTLGKRHSFLLVAHAIQFLNSNLPHREIIVAQ